MTPSRRALVLVLSTVALLALAAPAWAHVGIDVDNARPGALAEYTVHVPNESESATTDRIDVQLPDGLEVTDVRPGRGWTMAVDDGVLVITGGSIQPGEDRDFRFTATSPRERGEIVFPTIQTYSDGEEVRWIGEEGSDRPAPRVVLEGQPVAPATEPAQAQSPTPAATQAATEAPAAAGPSPSASVTVTPPPPTAAPTETAASDDSGGISPVVIALAVLAVIVAGVWVLLRRRPDA